MFSLICSWINGWVNNRKAGDLRRHRAHYDVIVMYTCRIYVNNNSLILQYHLFIYPFLIFCVSRFGVIQNDLTDLVKSHDISMDKWNRTHFYAMCKHDDVIKWKHFQRYWSFVRGIHRSPVNSPHKGQWRGALMFSLICAWISAWVNNRGAGDLRRQRAHCDVTVMNIHTFGD